MSFYNEENNESNDNISNNNNNNNNNNSNNISMNFNKKSLNQKDDISYSQNNMNSMYTNNENQEELYEEFFNYFLPSKKNYLNIKETKIAMRCLGILITEKELVDMLNLKSKNGNEQISLNDFIFLCNSKKDENHIEELEEAFKNFDPENSGLINAKELKHAMKVFKPKMNKEEIDQILSEFNIDEDGNINYVDFLSNLQN